MFNIFNTLLKITQTTLPIEKTNYFGFSIGPTYGLGFTFKKIINSFGVQITGFPYMKSIDENFFAGGLTGFYTLNKGTYGNLFISLGSGVARKKYIQYITDVQTQSTDIPAQSIDTSTLPNQIKSQPPQTTTKIVANSGFAVGPAIGMEFNFAENFTFAIELPVAFIFESIENNNFNFKSVLPIPNISLLYRY